MFFGYENKEKHPVDVSKKCCEEKNVDLLLMREEGNRNYVFIEYFNTFMHYHKLYRRRKHFCRYCLQAFSTEEILERHIKDCLKVNGKQKDYNS